MTQIPQDDKTFFKEVLTTIINAKLHKLTVTRKKIIDYREKSAKLTVDNAAYAKTEALEGYTLEYFKTYKEVEKLLKEVEG